MRRQTRTAIAAQVHVMWTDRQGQERFALGEAMDVCESGLRVLVPERIPERLYVRLRANAIGLDGSASVRSCVRHGTRYMLGLEFTGGLRWKPRPSKQKPTDRSETSNFEKVSR